MSSPVRVIAALIAGLAIGALLRSAGYQTLVDLAGAVEVLGTLWVNAIRMTVIPLVVSLLIVGIASRRESRNLGRLTSISLVVFLVTLSAVAVIVLIITPPIFSYLELDPAGVEALRASAAASPPPGSIPTVKDWLISLIPPNPFRAAADGALLPLIVFTIAFAFALVRVEERQRQAVTSLFRALSNAIFILVGWILALAPIGVFALALALGRTLGIDAAGAIGFYLVYNCSMLILVLLALYPGAMIFGGVRMGDFGRAAAPAQLVAFTTRSSLASLPAMMQSTRDRLRLPPEITGFVLPLAVSLFKLASPAYWVGAAMFVGALYGVELSFAELVIVSIASVVLSTSAPGIPGGGLLIKAPLYEMIGLPVAGLAILIAIDFIPDVFKTLVNVTGDMFVATVITRLWSGAGDSAVEGAGVGVI